MTSYRLVALDPDLASRMKPCTIRYSSDEQPSDQELYSILDSAETMVALGYKVQVHDLSKREVWRSKGGKMRLVRYPLDTNADLRI